MQERRKDYSTPLEYSKSFTRFDSTVHLYGYIYRANQNCVRSERIICENGIKKSRKPLLDLRRICVYVVGGA